MGARYAVAYHVGDYEVERLHHRVVGERVGIYFLVHGPELVAQSDYLELKVGGASLQVLVYVVEMEIRCDIGRDTIYSRGDTSCRGHPHVVLIRVCIKQQYARYHYVKRE